MQVGNNDRMILREQWHDRRPHMARLRITMQQDDRASLAANIIMDASAVDLGIVFGESVGNFAGSRELSYNQQERNDQWFHVSALSSARPAVSARTAAHG